MNERRRRQRLPWIKMEARIRVRKNLLSSTWEDVDVIDFSRLGMGMVTKHSFSRGDSLILSLRLATEVGDIVVDKVTALVRHREAHEKGFRLGLEFEEDQPEKVDGGLNRIEALLSRHSEVTERMR